jgi:hypothetical protein
MNYEEWSKLTDSCIFARDVQGGLLCVEPTGHNYCTFANCPMLELQNKVSPKIRYRSIK